MARRTRGSRLSPAARREQLVRLGMQLVAGSSFDAVSIDQVADEAGISRSLLFHYFPTKRDFQVAVAEAAADELLAATDVDPTLPPLERLHAALTTFVLYVSERRDAYLSVVRGTGGGDRALQAVLDRVHRTMADRILDGLGADQPSPLLRIAVRGWIAMVEESVVEWLTVGEPSREKLITLMEHTLFAVVASAEPRLAAAVAAQPAPSRGNVTTP